MFVNETLVALLEVKAGPVNVVNWLSIATGRNIVTAFGQTVAPVVTVSTELVGNLQPKDQNLQVSELSFLKRRRNNVTINV